MTWHIKHKLLSVWRMYRVMYKKKMKLVYSLTKHFLFFSFQISSSTGEITSRGNMDYERTPSYVFNVWARDGGVNPHLAVVQVTINVIDVNDNAPIFQPNSYTFSVEEQRSPRDVGTVKVGILVTFALWRQTSMDTHCKTYNMLLDACTSQKT